MGGQIYRFYDKNGDLLYIGSSGFALRRIEDHRARKPWFGDIATITIEYHATRRAAFDAEWAAIRDEKPKHNTLVALDWADIAAPSRVGQKCPDGCRCGRHSPTKLGIVTIRD